MVTFARALLGLILLLGGLWVGLGASEQGLPSPAGQLFAWAGLIAGGRHLAAAFAAASEAAARAAADAPARR